MEKYAVEESTQVPESLEKNAARATHCPRCGTKLEVHGRILMCPKCGTEPFEG